MRGAARGDLTHVLTCSRTHVLTYSRTHVLTYLLRTHALALLTYHLLLTYQVRRVLRELHVDVVAFQLRKVSVSSQWEVASSYSSN